MQYMFIEIIMDVRSIVEFYKFRCSNPLAGSIQICYLKKLYTRKIAIITHFLTFSLHYLHLAT